VAACRVVALAKTDTQVLGFGWIYLDGLFDQWFMSQDFGLPNPMIHAARQDKKIQNLGI